MGCDKDHTRKMLIGKQSARICARFSGAVPAVARTAYPQLLPAWLDAQGPGRVTTPVGSKRLKSKRRAMMAGRWPPVPCSSFRSLTVFYSSSCFRLRSIRPSTFVAHHPSPESTIFRRLPSRIVTPSIISLGFAHWKISSPATGGLRPLDGRLLPRSSCLQTQHVSLATESAKPAIFEGEFNRKRDMRPIAAVTKFTARRANMHIRRSSIRRGILGGMFRVVDPSKSSRTNRNTRTHQLCVARARSWLRQVPQAEPPKTAHLELATEGRPRDGYVYHLETGGPERRCAVSSKRVRDELDEVTCRTKFGVYQAARAKKTSS